MISLDGISQEDAALRARGQVMDWGTISSDASTPGWTWSSTSAGAIPPSGFGSVSLVRGESVLDAREPVTESHILGL